MTFTEDINISNGIQFTSSPTKNRRFLNVACDLLLFMKSKKICFLGLEMPDTFFQQFLVAATCPKLLRIPTGFRSRVMRALFYIPLSSIPYVPGSYERIMSIYFQVIQSLVRTLKLTAIFWLPIILPSRNYVLYAVTKTS